MALSYCVFLVFSDSIFANAPTALSESDARDACRLGHVYLSPSPRRLFATSTHRCERNAHQTDLRKHLRCVLNEVRMYFELNPDDQ